MVDEAIVREKTDQAVEALRDLDVDCWLTYCRETDTVHEPCLPFVLGYDVVWPTMVLVTREGRTVVVVGENDAAAARDLGVHEVYEYGESLEGTFLDVLAEVDPGEIAVNYSEDDETADGLTHGMYRRLTGYLAGTPYEGRLRSAAPVVGRVRGEKSPTERERLHQAADLTAELFASMEAAWRPSWTEADVADWYHERMDDRGLESAWSWAYCPTVHAGGDAEVGHTVPGDRTLPAGEVLHVDFGVKYEGYAADLQRLWYLPSDADPDPPDDLDAAFEDVRAAIGAAAAVLEPGAVGHEVDRAAREEITDRGWPSFNHGVGHQVGRNAHDGGTLLGPRWEPYGDAPNGTVRAGEFYTLELGVDTGYGYLGQEELFEVTDDGVEYVVPPQTELRTLPAR